MEALPKEMTIGECYCPAMEITEQAEADEYFRLLVERCLKYFGMTQAEAEDAQRQSLGYFAGYYDSETEDGERP